MSMAFYCSAPDATPIQVHVLMFFAAGREIKEAVIEAISGMPFIDGGGLRPRKTCRWL